MRGGKNFAAAAAAAVLSGSCGNPARPDPPSVAPVMFSYHSPVPADQAPRDPVNVTGCVHHYSAMGGVFVLSGSWAPDTLYRDFQGDCNQICTVTVPGIPTGREHAVRMWDLGMCNLDALSPPLSFENLLANGVSLSRIVDHASGMRGVAFTLNADGRVTP